MVMATTASELDTLRARWRAAVRRAMQRGPALVSVGIVLPAVDPLDLFARFAGTARDRFYWERPADDVAFAGAGAAWTIESPSAIEAGRSWRALLAGAIVDAPIVARRAASTHGDSLDTPGLMDGPLLVGGFAFDRLRPATSLWQGYPSGRLVLPRLTLVTQGDTSTLTVNAIVSSTVACDIDAMVDDVEAILASRTVVGTTDGAAGRGDHGYPWVEDVLPRAEWEALVAGGARACREDALCKVVLARSVRVHARDDLDVVAVLRDARAAYPNAFTFAVARGDRAFVGATPERLVRLYDGAADVACLAGSTGRGAMPEEDRLRGDLLLASPKDRAEHLFVVDAVRDALADACPDLQIPAAPRLLRLHNVQHLYTPVTGRVAPGTGVLDLVARLHPTPAVGGQPREEALAYIRAHEGLDRGWYAAPVGWLNGRGEGEFAVALRSALVSGDEATLFAGCGIVASSSPAAEYEETRLKLRPMLAALGARQERL